jgi:aldehyde:ferredoxin oxidoreductase
LSQPAPGGWTGRWLFVDLSSGEQRVEPADLEAARRFIGGRGLGAWLLATRFERVAALAPEAPLIFTNGPLTATRAQTSARYSVSAWSPLTGTVFDSNSGGRFGEALKRAGFDALAVSGRAPAPVVLRITPAGAELTPADELWGMNLDEALPRLDAEGVAVAIGRAGERQVRIAGMACSGGHFNARGGLGALMGSKQLKAVVVSGRGAPVRVAAPERFERALADVKRLIVASPVASKGLSVYGTSVLVNLANEMRILPVHNFRRTHAAEAGRIAGERIADEHEAKRAPCRACPIACKRRLRAGGEVPEYETLALLGSNLGLFDLEALIEANARCNAYGLDTISLGAAVAVDAEIRGEALTPPRLLEQIRLIGEAEGAGALLGQGARAVAKAAGAPALAMQVKGLDLPGYDPRGSIGQGLGYATSNRGGCHLRAYMVGPEIFGKPKLIDRFSYSGKAGLVPVFQNLFAAVDSLVLCKFLLFAAGEEEIAGLLTGVTGEPWRAEDLMRAGERIWNLERLLNLEAGFGARDDTLPDRFFDEDGTPPVPRLHRRAFSDMLDEYYRFRGWDAEGRPLERTLVRLGLGAVPRTPGGAS